MMISETLAKHDVEAAALEESLARDDLLSFFLLFHPGWHGDTFHRRLCRRLMQFHQDVRDRKFPCLLIEAPPQHGKSSIVSRAFQAWMLGHDSSWPIAIASYAASLATGHGRWIRNTMELVRYRNIFPDAQVADDSAAKDFFHTTLGGQFRAIGVDGGLAGQPARVLTVDDPYASMEEADSATKRASVESWWESVALARMAEGGGKLMMLTRYRLDDIAGALLDRGKKNPDADQWDVFSFPAIAKQDEYEGSKLIRRKGAPLSPRVHSAGDLRRKKAGMSARNWMAMYQQEPIADGGEYFKKDGARTYTEKPRVGDVYVAADMAFRAKEDSDDTAMGAFSEDDDGNLVFLPGIVIDRIQTDIAVEKLLDLVERYGALAIVMGRDMIEGSIGPFLRTRMQQRDVLCSIITKPEKGDKMAKARSYQARWQQQRVLWPEGDLFREVILPQHLGFPSGKDDVIDFAANACYVLDSLTEPEPERETVKHNSDVKRWEHTKKNAARHRGTEPSIRPLFGE